MDTNTRSHTDTGHSMEAEVEAKQTNTKEMNNILFHVKDETTTTR